MVPRRAQRPLLLRWQGSRVCTLLVRRSCCACRHSAPPPPTAVAAAFGIVVTAAEQAVAQGNLSPLVTNHVAAAGTKLTSYCHARS